jgi:hypothetical protein
MTKINPVQSFNSLPKAKKAAVITSAAVGTAAAASAVAAFCLGKGKVEAKGIKAVLPALKAGYAEMGKFAAKTAKKAWNFVTEKFGVVKEWITGKFSKTAEKVQDVAQQVAEDVA